MDLTSPQRSKQNPGSVQLLLLPLLLMLLPLPLLMVLRLLLPLLLPLLLLRLIGRRSHAGDKSIDLCLSDTELELHCS